MSIKPNFTFTFTSLSLSLSLIHLLLLLLLFIIYFSYLGIKKKSSNLAARSELGRFPIKIPIDQKILNYFIHLNSLDDNSLCKQALNLSHNFSANHKTFYSGIQTLLTEHNLPIEIIRQNRTSIFQSQNIKNKYIEY